MPRKLSTYRLNDLARSQLAELRDYEESKKPPRLIPRRPISLGRILESIIAAQHKELIK